MLRFTRFCFYVLVPALAVVIQGETAGVPVQKLQTRVHSAKEDSASHILKMAEEMEEAIAIGFGDGQRGKRLSTNPDSSKVDQRRISSRLRHKDRAALVEDLGKWAMNMKKEADRLLAGARQSVDLKKRQIAGKLQTVIRQLRNSVEKLPTKDRQEPDPKIIKKIETALARVSTHTKEWTDYNDSDPGV